MGRPAINTVFNPAADKDAVQPDRAEPTGNRLRWQVPPERHRRPQVLLEPRLGRCLLGRAGGGTRRGPDPGRPRLQPHEHAARTAQRPRSADDVIDVELNVTTGGDPLDLFADRNADRRRARRRRRSAHGLPRALPVSRQAALSRGTIEGGPPRATLVANPTANGTTLMTTSNPTVPNSSRRPRSPRPLAIIGATALILVGSYAFAALRPTTVPQAPTVPGGRTCRRRSGDRSRRGDHRRGRERPSGRSSRSTIRSPPGRRTWRPTPGITYRRRIRDPIRVAAV